MCELPSWSAPVGPPGKTEQTVGISVTQRGKRPSVDHQLLQERALSWGAAWVLRGKLPGATPMVFWNQEGTLEWSPWRPGVRPVSPSAVTTGAPQSAARPTWVVHGSTHCMATQSRHLYAPVSECTFMWATLKINLPEFDYFTQKDTCFTASILVNLTPVFFNVN